MGARMTFFRGYWYTLYKSSETERYYVVHVHVPRYLGTTDFLCGFLCGMLFVWPVLRVTSSSRDDKNSARKLLHVSIITRPITPTIDDSVWLLPSLFAYSS